MTGEKWVKLLKDYLGLKAVFEVGVVCPFAMTIMQFTLHAFI